MENDASTDTHSAWLGWSEHLRQHGLDGLVAWLLEAAGPLTVVGAQLVYFTSPLLRPAMSSSQVSDLAELLENPAESHLFAAFLREDTIT